MYEAGSFKEGSSVITSSHIVNKQKRMNDTVSLVVTLCKMFGRKQEMEGWCKASLIMLMVL
jgi:hypothetical protein